MIKIKEVTAFGQVITAVLDENRVNENNERDIILDLRKGEVSEHAKTCARYHAKKQDQGMILIERVNTFDSHIKTVED